MPRKTTWYSMAKNADDKHGTIYIFEEIGFWGITAADFANDLVSLGDINTITLHLSSPGGSVGDGLAIYNALKHHKATVTVEIDGYALSMGSIIALAGDTVKMAENALYMIHNPWGFAWGDSDDLRKSADIGDKTKEAMINTYHSKTGISREELAKMMDEETWFTALEALNWGFVDEVTDEVKMAASANTLEFLHDLGLQNRPENFFNGFDTSNNLDSQILQSLKKMFTKFKKNKKEESNMTLEDLKNLFNRKNKVDEEYQEAVKNNPDLANQVEPKPSDTDPDPSSDKNTDSTKDDDADITAKMTALEKKVSDLEKNYATMKTNHDDLISKLSKTVESFSRDEAGSGSKEDLFDDII